MKIQEPEIALRNAIADACSAVRQHPLLPIEWRKRRGDFSILAETGWAHRARDWVPSDPYQFVTRLMTRAEMKEICEAIARIKDTAGQTIATASQIKRIEDCWNHYRDSALKIEEYTSKALTDLLNEKGVDSKDLHDCEAFRRFLFSIAYEPILRGDMHAAKRNVRIVLREVGRGAQNNSDGSGRICERQMQIEACVALLAFLGYVAEDETEAIMLQRLQRMKSLSANPIFITGRLLSHLGHGKPGTTHFDEVLSLAMNGAPLDIPTYERASSACFHNAARAAIERGAVFSSRLAKGNHRSIDWIVKRGMELTSAHNDLDSILRYRLLEAQSHANEGRYYEALRVATSVRMELLQHNTSLKHLELRLNRVEAVIYARLIPKSKEFGFAARERLLAARKTAKELKLNRTTHRIESRLSGEQLPTDWD